MDALIISGVALIAIGLIFPCLAWFVRNLCRIVLKKDLWWLTNSLKFIWITGILVAILGIILIIVKLLI